MDQGKKIDIGASSALIDLKAELARKKSELEEYKIHQGPVPKLQRFEAPRDKPGNLKYKNRGVDARNQRDLAARAEEAASYEKSKSIMERKVKLYDEMTSKALSLDETEHPVLLNALVDFQKKAIDNHEEDVFKTAKVSTFEKDGDEWAEFTDSFGRTRRCLKEDLPGLIARDRQTAQNFKKGDEAERPQPLPKSLPGFATEEEVREAKREKWDKEAEIAAKKDKVHYEDMRYDEAREHGVGYYKLAGDENTRAGQLKDLKKLSELTEESRTKVKEEKGKKRGQLKDRLRKIHEKKRAKLGLPPLPPEESSEEEEEVIGPQPKSDSENSEEEEARKKEVRPWDFGKKGVGGAGPSLTSEELDAKWVRDRRGERKTEFAPPTSLYAKDNTKKYGNFVRGKEDNPLSRPLAQGPVKIRNELLEDDEPSPNSSSSRSNFNKGAAIPPPPSFDYYHGGGRGRGSRAPPPKSEMEEGVLEGLRSIRRQMDEGGSGSS